jgi:hypothetical protein
MQVISASRATNYKYLFINNIFITIGFCLLCAATAVQAQVARVLDTKGTALVERSGQIPRLLGAGERLDERDVINVARDSWAILEFNDQTRITLRPNTVFRIGQYKQDAPESMVMGLLKGGLRAVTGLIAKRNRAGVRFEAGTATIGIRGTDFDMRLCEAECLIAESTTVARADQTEFAGRVGGIGGGVIAVDTLGRVRRLAVSAPVNAGDIVAAMNGIAVLVMRDQTRLSLDPGTALLIREFSYDDAMSSTARAELALLAGRAQVATGQLAKAHPERFRFFVGDLPVRVHGTIFGAVKESVLNASNVAQNAGNTVEAGRKAGVSGGGISVNVREGAVTVGAGETAIRLNSGELGSDTGGRLAKGEGRLDFLAPDPGRVTVANFDGFFGQLAAAAGKSAPPGVYVSVNDGAVVLAQGGKEVQIARGEAAMAPADGSPPVKVRNGVRVTRNADLNAAIAGLPICTDQPSTAGIKSSATAAVGMDLASTPSYGNVPVNVDGKLNANAIDPTNTQGIGKGGGDDTGGGNPLGGNRFGPGFGGNTAIEDSAKTTGSNIGRGGLDGLQSNRIITGRHGDTFAGNRLNQGVDARNFGGGGGARRGQVSSGDEGDSASLGGNRYIIGVTSDEEDAANEAEYAQAVGTDGYEATKDMTYGQRLEYWAKERDRQMGGGASGSELQAERNRQQIGVRPREDDNPSGGGSGAPIYLGAGQFGNEIRGVGRAVGAKVGAAGGSGDGRADQQVSGGDTGGPAMQRGEQLGLERAVNAGPINWDAALRINQLVNPGSQ